MAFDQKQRDLLQAHLQGKGMVCPACQNQRWQLVQVISLPAPDGVALTNPLVQAALAKASPTGPSFLVPKVFAGKEEMTLPVAVVACTTCFFLMTFAWRPIVEQAVQGAAGGQKL